MLNNTLIVNEQLLIFILLFLQLIDNLLSDL